MLLVLIMAFAMLTGCAAPNPPADDKPADESKQPAAETETSTAPESEAPAAGGKIAGVVFQEDQFMKLLQLGYADTCAGRGYEFVPGNTNNDQAKEAEFINTYCDQKYVGLAISPISETASLPGLQQALDAGITVGLSNTLFNDEPRFVGSFSSDNYELGKATGLVAADFIKNKMDGKAKVAIIQFKSLLAEQSSARSNGFIDQIKDIPGVEIVVDQDAWLQDKAITVATDILTANPDINLIFAANEGGTIGSTMAVQNAGLAGKVYVFGTDASEQIVGFLKDDTNVLQAVTGQDPYNIGVLTMNAICDVLEGKEVDTMGQGIIVPGTTLTREKPEELDAFLAELQEKVSKLG